MFSSTTNYTINTLPNKKEIIARLFKDGYINIDEVVELMKEQPSVNVTPVAPAPSPWDNPLKYPWDSVSPYERKPWDTVMYAVNK